MRAFFLPFAFLALLFSSSAELRATAQFPDHLSYEGEGHAMFSTPLEGYFSDTLPRPAWLVPTSTACWRGYVASWEIKDDRLFLLKVVRRDGPGAGEEKDVIARLFPKGQPPIEATWFSGAIRIPQGKQLRYVHMGFGSIYERDLFLTFDHGKLTGRNVVRNDPSTFKDEP